MTEYKMLIAFFKDNSKYCTKMMSKFKGKNSDEYHYWKGKRKAFRRSLQEIRLTFK